jgi:hypothetical protein
MAKKEPEIPLKELMSALDRKDRDYFSRLTDSQKKAFSAWMLLRYASSAQGRDAAHFIYMVNEVSNLYFSDITKHPELQWLLFTVCGTKRIQYHYYVKPPTAKKKKDKVRQFVQTVFPLIKDDELELFLTINNKSDLKELAQAHGHSDKEISEIFGK